MIQDPVFALFAIILRRVLIFIIASIFFGLLIWYWLLASHFGVPRSDLIAWLRAAFSPTHGKVAAIFLYGSLIFGILISGVFSLLIAHWWKKRASVQYHRGARLD